MLYGNNESLAHFGIFGMKWGVRRYQNEDGTLTEEGKKRYSMREKDVEYAKEYAKKELSSDKKRLSFWNKEVQKSRDIPVTKEGIKSRIHISDTDYEDYLRKYKTPEKIKKSIISDDLHEAKMYERRIKDWNKKLKALERTKIDAIQSDRQHQKQIDDIFTQAQGWFFRWVDLFGLHQYMNQARKKDAGHIEKKQTSSIKTPTVDHFKTGNKKTLSQRFDDALKDNPNLTYKQIYKEMGVNMRSEDPDDYKDAEDRWFKKHGY